MLSSTTKSEVLRLAFYQFILHNSADFPLVCRLHLGLFFTLHTVFEMCVVLDAFVFINSTFSPWCNLHDFINHHFRLNRNYIFKVNVLTWYWESYNCLSILMKGEKQTNRDSRKKDKESHGSREQWCIVWLCLKSWSVNVLHHLKNPTDCFFFSLLGWRDWPGRIRW